MIGISVELTPLRRSLAIARRVADRLDVLESTSEVDRWAIRGHCPRLGELDIAELLRLSQYGHAVEIDVVEGGWSLVVRADGLTKPIVEAAGSAEAALAEADVDPMARAVARGDAAAALQLAAQMPATVAITLRNDYARNGGHWIERTEDLLRLLSGAAWSQTASLLDAEPSVLIVEDAADAMVATDGLILAGPAAALRAQGRRLDDSGYRERRVGARRLMLPSPIRFANPTRCDGAGPALDGLVPILHGVTRCLVWYWLASQAEVAGHGSVTAVISGARTVSLVLTPEQADESDEDLMFYRWATATADPAREESAQQAASLAIVSAADLPTAAGPALRTAKSLYNLARRGAVGEALAARRAAREAALGAARQAAGAARQAAGKSVERVLVQAGAAGAVVLSNAADIIGTATGAVLLVVVAAVAVASLVVTRRVDLPSAESSLANELRDLDQYRDTLSQDDIEAIRQISSVGSAQSDLARARRTITIMYSAATVSILLLGGLFLFAGGSQASSPPPSHGRSTSSPTGTDSPSPTVRIPNPSRSVPTSGPSTPSPR